jgi:hypothetical protein
MAEKEQSNAINIAIDEESAVIEKEVTEADQRNV